MFPIFGTSAAELDNSACAPPSHITMQVYDDYSWQSKIKDWYKACQRTRFCALQHVENNAVEYLDRTTPEHECMTSET
jgi:hypothetical protein